MWNRLEHNFHSFRLTHHYLIFLVFYNHMNFVAQFCVQDLPADLEIHYIVVNDWALGVDSPQNVVLISIPSVLDPSLAPPGKHVLHAYTPGTEPYNIWAGLDRKSAAYRKLKTERSEVCFIISSASSPFPVG